MILHYLKTHHHFVHRAFIGLLGASALLAFDLTSPVGQKPVINASSSLVQEVYHSNLRYLHSVGNRRAELANGLAVQTNLHNRAAGRATCKYPIYHHNKYGNYWSYFRDHQAIGNNVPDKENNDDDDRTSSGILAEEVVLSRHGIKCGVNRYYSSLY